jgi:hypothetical protein
MIKEADLLGLSCFVLEWPSLRMIECLIAILSQLRPLIGSVVSLVGLFKEFTFNLELLFNIFINAK